MDPLSITASAIALITAINKISTSLTGFAKSIRTADSQVVSLKEELTHLTGFLKAVHDTIKGCRSFDFALVEEDLWRQSELALSTCQATLNELQLLVNEIQGVALPKKLGRKARIALILNVHSSRLANFRDKIHKSNWALQTILHTITVSLSLRNNVSQARILSELDRLQVSIDQALRASSASHGRLSHSVGQPSSDTQVARNLHDLAQAAKHFHSAASTTASTVYGDASDRSDAPWQSYPGADISLCGDFPTHSRERVEMFIRASGPLPPQSQNQSQIRPSRPVSISGFSDEGPDVSLPNRHAGKLRRGQHDNARVQDTRELEDDQTEHEDDKGDDEDDEFEFQQEFLVGLRELIAGCIKTGKYAKAIEFIDTAMTSKGKSYMCDAEVSHLKKLLALCYILQGKWTLAEPVVADLSRKRLGRDTIVCDLLHSLSLAHLIDYSFESSLALCRKALFAKKRLCESGSLCWTEYGETLGLLSTIHEVSGNYLWAEVHRRKMPQGKTYRHPRSVLHFLAQNSTLLLSLVGDVCLDLDSVLAEPELSTWEAEHSFFDDDALPGTTDLASEGDNVLDLQAQLSRHERLEMDTSKEVMFDVPSSPTSGSDADIESCASTPTSDMAPKRRLTQLLSRVRDGRLTQGAASGDSDSDLPSPSSPSSPIRSWLKDRSYFGLKSPIEMLRRRSTKKLKAPSRRRHNHHTAKPNSFRILNVKKMSTLDGLPVAAVSPVDCPNSPDQLYFWHERNVDAASVSESEPLSTQPAELFDTQKTAELADTPQRTRLIPNTQFMYPGLTSSHQRGPAEPFTQSDKLDKSTFSFTPAIGDPALFISYSEARVALIDAAYLYKSEEVQSLPLKSLPLKSPPIKRHQSCKTLCLDIQAASNCTSSKTDQQPSYSQKPLSPSDPPHVPIDPAASDIIDWLSSILASLPDITDAEDLLLCKSALLAMLPELSRGSDPVLVHDVRRVIQSLEKRVKYSHPAIDDSGYESMEAAVETSSKTRGDYTSKPARSSFQAVQPAQPASAYSDRPLKMQAPPRHNPQNQFEEMKRQQSASARLFGSKMERADYPGGCQCRVPTCNPVRQAQ